MHLLASWCGPATARAEEQPAILKAYDLDWIERVRDDAWPQPKQRRPVICLLDTGVDITPDTPADSLDGPIVARLALDGGTGLPQGTSWEHQHGTQMASIIAAPRNGYGTVGVFPQARIVSIRVTDKSKDEVYITPGLMARGVRACGIAAEVLSVRVAAVVMAESNYSQRTIDRGFWDEAGRSTRTSGGLMFAAVGNAVDATTVPPLGVSTLVPVVAAGKDGGRCKFSPQVESPLLVAAPGCEGAPWPDGSSQATAIAGAVTASYITRNPAIGVDEALNVVTGADRSGLSLIRGSNWKQAMASLTNDLPGPSQSATTPLVDALVETPVSDTTVRLWKPRLASTWRRGRLEVRRLDSKGGLLHVRVGRSEYTIPSRLWRRRLPKKPQRLDAWVVSRGGKWRSLSVVSRVVS